jgi:hypothetical protein
MRTSLNLKTEILSSYPTVNSTDKASTTDQGSDIKQSHPQPIENLHFVLGIDDALAKEFYFQLEDLNAQKFLAYPWFKERGLVINALTAHVIHPGVIELIQYLLTKIPNTTISFYSSGAEERNKPFVEELIKKAFPQNFNEIMQKILILSRKDCPDGRDVSQDVMFQGNKKKDLRKVLKANDSLSNVILIADDPSWAYPGQEKNILVTPSNSRFHPYNQSNILHEDDFIEANHVFHMIGMLKFALKNRTGSLTETLFSLQYDLNNSRFYSTSMFTSKKYNKQFLIDGLNELKTINPKIEFYGNIATINKYLSINATQNAADNSTSKTPGAPAIHGGSSFANILSKLHVEDDKTATIMKSTDAKSILSEDIKLNPEQKLLKTIINEIEDLSDRTWVSFKSIDFKSMPNFKRFYNETSNLQLSLARFDNSQITKQNLYDALLENWFEKSLAKRLSDGTMPSNGSDPMSFYFEFAGSLAEAMLREDISVINKDKVEIWKTYFTDNSNPDLVDARNACPLVLNDKGYIFIHPLLREYFCVRQVANVEYKPTPYMHDFEPRNIP